METMVLSVELKMLVWTAGVTILMWVPYIGATLLQHGPITALQYRDEPLEIARAPSIWQLDQRNLSDHAI